MALIGRPLTLQNPYELTLHYHPIQHLLRSHSNGELNNGNYILSTQLYIGCQ